MTSEYCITCRRQRYVDAEDHQRVAQHRIEHRRLDRRRAQWRAYAERKRLQDGRIGTLHNLACTRTRCRCKPIPVYRLAEDAA
jgi:hypothetical protein